MKSFLKIMLFALFATASLPSFSQEDLIDLSLSLPSGYEDLDSGQTERLNNRIKQVVARNGIMSDFFGGSFTINPIFVIADRTTAEGGMKPVVRTTVELTFEVIEAASKTTFSSVTRSIAGAGFSETQSLNNAINAIAATDPQFKKFFATVRQKISAHYAAHCDKYLAKAFYLLDIKEYRTAQVVLHSIPDGIACSGRAKELGVSLALLMQNEALPKDTLKTDSIQPQPMPVPEVTRPVVLPENNASEVKEIRLNRDVYFRYVDCEEYGDGITKLNFLLINKGNVDQELEMTSMFAYDGDGSKFFPDRITLGNQTINGYNWGFVAKALAISNVNVKVCFQIRSTLKQIVLVDLKLNGAQFKFRNLVDR